MSGISILKIFWIFAKISTCTLGGGYAMLPVFEEELVKKRSWLTAEDMLAVLAVAQSCPGLIAVNVAVFAGVRLRRLPGALSAVAGVVLTPFLSIILLAGFVNQVAESMVFSNALAGVRAGVAALILIALEKLRKKTLRGFFPWFLAVGSFAAMVVWQINPIWLIAAGALSGIVGRCRQTDG